MIPDSYEDNFSNQPAKKVHIIESDAVEDETEWEMYCLKNKIHDNLNWQINTIPSYQKPSMKISKVDIWLRRKWWVDIIYVFPKKKTY